MPKINRIKIKSMQMMKWSIILTRQKLNTIINELKQVWIRTSHFFRWKIRVNLGFSNIGENIPLCIYKERKSTSCHNMGGGSTSMYHLCLFFCNVYAMLFRYFLRRYCRSRRQLRNILVKLIFLIFIAYFFCFS